MANKAVETKELLRLLHKVDFFSKLKMGQLDALVRKVKKESFAKGKTVIKEGEMGDAFYMISSGQVSVWHNKSMFNKPIFLTNMEPGEFFGEMALVMDQPRSATVVAETRCDFFVLYKDDFRKILMENPEISVCIEEALARRMARSAKKRG